MSHQRLCPPCLPSLPVTPHWAARALSCSKGHSGLSGHHPLHVEPESDTGTRGGATAASGPIAATGKVPSGILEEATRRQGQDHPAQEGSLGGRQRRPNMEQGDEGGGKRWAQWPWGRVSAEAARSMCRAFQQERQPCLPAVPGRDGQTLGKSPSSSGPRVLPANSSERTQHPGLVRRWRTDSRQ